MVLPSGNDSDRNIQELEVENPSNNSSYSSCPGLMPCPDDSSCSSASIHSAPSSDDSTVPPFIEYNTDSDISIPDLFFSSDKI